MSEGKVSARPRADGRGKGRDDKFQGLTTPCYKRMRKQSKIPRTDEHGGKDEYWKGEANESRRKRAKIPR